MAGLKAGNAKPAGPAKAKGKAGHWVTGDDGRRYFITGSGERLSGPAAYKAYKSSMGFVAGKKAPISSSDARVKALRESRGSALKPGVETDPSRPARERREDKILIKTPSGIAVDHHYGKPAPKFTKAEADALKPAVKRYEAGKKLSADEEPLALRYLDHKASRNAVKPGEHSLLVFDRRNGELSVRDDSDIRLSPLRAESFRSGRFEILKAYDHTGAEIRVDAAIREKFSGGKGATRESNLKKARSGLKAG